MQKSYRIEARKKDDRLHYYWMTEKIFESDEVIAFHNHAPREVVHHTKNETYPFDSHGLEIFWPGAPFSLGLAVREGMPDTIAYYCNVHEPFIRVDEKTIHFIDLDLDVVKSLKENRAKIVDWEEFEEHSKLYNYPSSYLKSVPEISEKVMNHLNDNFTEKYFLDYFQSVKGKKELGSTLNEIKDKLEIDRMPSL